LSKMPICTFHTNLKESALKDGVELRLAKAIAELLAKPLDKMVIVIVPGGRLLREGTTEPALVLNINSVAVFDAERNPTYGPVLRKLIQDEFGLSEDRVAIIYQDLDRNFIG
jgi:hypothetical protein